MRDQGVHSSLKRLSDKVAWHVSDKLLDASKAVTDVLPPIGRGRRHGLPANLVVTLTSYPPRYPALKATLKRLLSQTIRADHIILWLTEPDRRALPANILSLQRYGLEIRDTKDYGPHKKYLEARRQFPSAYLVTVDDDMAYKRTMLAQLIASLSPLHNAKSTVAHRARKILIEDGRPRPYWSWPLVENGGLTSEFYLATGSGGTLYPPGSLSDEVLDIETAMSLSPKTDDLWLHWMTRRAGFVTTIVDHPNRAREWNDNQEVALWSGTNRDENDAAIGRLTVHFGPIVPDHVLI